MSEESLSIAQCFEKFQFFIYKPEVLRGEIAAMFPLGPIELPFFWFEPEVLSPFTADSESCNVLITLSVGMLGVML